MLSPGIQSGVNTRLCNLMIKTPTPEIGQNLCYLLLTQSFQYREQLDAAAHGSSLPLKVIAKGC